MVENLEERKAFHRPGDIGITESSETLDLMSAKTFKDIIELSGGIYHPRSNTGSGEDYFLKLRE